MTAGTDGRREDPMTGVHISVDAFSLDAAEKQKLRSIEPDGTLTYDDMCAGSSIRISG